MDARFYKGLKTEEEKEQMKMNFVSSGLLRTKVVSLLTEELEAVRRESRKEDNFDKAAWSEYIAFKLGEEKRIIKLIKLLSDKGEEK